ncbi:hypothetical protein bAD24_I09535 [Burkholderia sp. AD24]|nr:hypothetical protein bAD24_I09535 [Burkholderia sp. AD24]
MTDDDRLFLQRTVPRVDYDGRPFGVRLATVPQPWRDELVELCRRQALHVFDADGGGHCMYPWDWEDWLNDRLSKPC